MVFNDFETMLEILWITISLLAVHEFRSNFFDFSQKSSIISSFHDEIERFLIHSKFFSICCITFRKSISVAGRFRIADKNETRRFDNDDEKTSPRSKRRFSSRFFRHNRFVGEKTRRKRNGGDQISIAGRNARDGSFRLAKRKFLRFGREFLAKVVS